MKTKELIKKEKDHAFGKDVYLLGKDAEGVKYWLESPSWDCGWYWGFGYVETYQRNWRPSLARDIEAVCAIFICNLHLQYSHPFAQSHSARVRRISIVAPAWEYRRKNYRLCWKITMQHFNTSH